MKKTLLFVLIAGLLVSSAFAQDENGKVPLDLSRFVKTVDESVTEKPAEPPLSKTPTRKKRIVDFKSSTEVSVDYSRQFLTNGRGTWDEAALGVIHKFSRRKVLYASFAETKRFDERDRGAMIGFYQPLSKEWTLLVEASASPTHRILPQWSAMAQIERSFGKGWIGHAAYRRTELDAAEVNIGKFGVEKYWGLNRAAYAVFINNLEDTGTSASHQFRYDRYYRGELSAVGVSFAVGEEIEKTGPNTVIQSDVHSVTVFGKHAFSRRWALAYGLTYHRQGDIYTRRGLNVGLRFKF